MNRLVILIIFEFCKGIFTPDAESADTIKYRRFIVEIGRNSSYILSNKLTNNGHNYRKSHGLNRLTLIGVGYSFNNDKNLLTLNYSIYGNYFSLEKEKNDNIYELFFNHLSLGLSRKILQKRGISDYTQFSLNYRNGVEFIYIGTAFGHYIVDASEYKSLGLGVSNTISYSIRKRFYLAFELGYYHFFEKSRLNYPPNSPNYSPNKDFLSGSVKIGVKLF